MPASAPDAPRRLEAREELARIDDMGGAVAAIDTGYSSSSLSKRSAPDRRSIRVCAGPQGVASAAR
jgi:hypothetical protein